jgi:non-specific serine/threonine protein kinase
METLPPSPFGALVRTYRLRAKLTQEVLAERAALSPRGLAYLERGERQPYRDTVRRLCEALNITAAERADLEEAARAASRLLATDTSDVSLTNLPLEITTFVGREQELATLAELLVHARLLTLMGTGGVGKTRLAFHLAAQLVEHYAQGVWVVDLAPLADPTLVPQAIAAVVGVQEEASRPLLAALVEALRRRHLLLILDNCEHLIAACAAVAESLLQACPQVQILATSREALGLTGETLWRVPSLELPDRGPLPPPPQLVQVAAVRLFVERAAAVRPTFALTPQNAPAVTAICQRLDGIPLAVELAAARVSALPLGEIAARLDQSLQILTGGARTALPRQQTLRGTLDWSYALLREPERVLFRRLCVFAGGFTLEAAEAVCAGDAIVSRDVLELLVRLVDQSLVVAEESAARDVGRYRLLEPVRQYGWERLAAHAETAVVQAQHAAYYRDLAERAERALHGPDQIAWRELIEVEHDNVRAALAWSLGEEADGQAVEGGVCLAGAMGEFWFQTTHRWEGLRWLERALARSSGEASAPRAKALLWAGVLAWGVSEVVRAQRLLTESVGVARAAGDGAGLALALTWLGYVMGHTGAAARGLACVEEGLALAREGGDRLLIAYALIYVAHIVCDTTCIEQPDLRARAWECAEESLPLFQTLGWGVGAAQRAMGQLALYEHEYARAQAAFSAVLTEERGLGHRAGEAMALASLGDVARAQGDHDAATARLEESAAVYRALDFDRELLAGVLRRLGEVALERGDHRRARAYLSECVEVAGSVGVAGEPHIAAALLVFGSLAAAQGKNGRAVRLAGAAAALQERVGLPWPLEDQSSVRHWIDLAKEVLGPAEQAAEWEKGQMLEQGQAIAEALSD